MRLSEVEPILSQAPLALETGYERFEDGVLHVACRTDLHNCTGEMFEWWFRFRPDTQKYIWWHPVDHIFSDWIECQADTHIGSMHLVEEGFTGLPSAKLAIQFRDAAEFFAVEALENARAKGSVTAAVCGRISASHTPPRTPQGAVLGGRLLHVGRDTEWGCALRSHFYLGQDLPMLGKSPQEITTLFPDRFAVALLQHCYNEFVFLSRFLPSLYIAENRDRHTIQLPW